MHVIYYLDSRYKQTDFLLYFEQVEITFYDNRQCKYANKKKLCNINGNHKLLLPLVLESSLNVAKARFVFCL